MAHNQHVGGLGHQLLQGTGHNPGLDLGAALGFFCLAAVEGEVVTILHHCLIAAAAQGHFDAQGCKVVAFLEIGAVFSDADAQGCGGAKIVGDIPNGVENREFCVDIVGKLPLLEDEQVAVALQPAEDAGRNLRPSR